MRSAGRSGRVAAGLCMLVAAGGALGAENAPPGARPAFLVPLPGAPSWKDFAYLAAVPAGAKAGGRPVVIALDECATTSPETADLLRRYRPTATYLLDCAVRPVPTGEGLAAYWPLDDGAGLRCLDGAGGEAGRLRRLPAWEVEHEGGLRFDGRTFTVEHGSVPGSARELTVAFWMKADRAALARPIAKHDDSHRAPGWIVMLRPGNEKSSLRFRVGGGGEAWSQSDVAAESAYRAGEWVHVACTHAGGTSRIYLDGNLAATREKIAWATPNNTSSPLVIGTPGGAAQMTVASSVVPAGGSFAATSGTLSVSGDFVSAGGSFGHSGATVGLSDGDQAVAGSTTFNSLAKSVAARSVLVSEHGQTQTVAGTLTLRGIEGGRLVAFLAEEAPAPVPDRAAMDHEAPCGLSRVPALAADDREEFAAVVGQEVRPLRGLHGSIRRRRAARSLSRSAFRNFRSRISAGSRTIFEGHPAARLLAAR